MNILPLDDKIEKRGSFCGIFFLNNILTDEVMRKIFDFRKRRFPEEFFKMTTFFHDFVINFIIFIYKVAGIVKVNFTYCSL